MSGFTITGGFTFTETLAPLVAVGGYRIYQWTSSGSITF